MNFEIAIVSVGLARQQALDLALARLFAQLFEVLFSFRDDRRVALGIAELDQLDRVIDLALDAAIAVDRAIEAGALAQQRLRRGRVVPQLGVFRLGV
jgi:hypothetical protein